MQAYFLESVAISLGRYLQLLLLYLQKQVILKQIFTLLGSCTALIDS